MIHAWYSYPPIVNPISHLRFLCKISYFSGMRRSQWWPSRSWKALYLPPWSLVLLTLEEASRHPVGTLKHTLGQAPMEKSWGTWSICHTCGRWPLKVDSQAPVKHSDDHHSNQNLAATTRESEVKTNQQCPSWITDLEFVSIIICYFMAWIFGVLPTRSQ